MNFFFLNIVTEEIKFSNIDIGFQIVFWLITFWMNFLKKIKYLSEDLRNSFCLFVTHNCACVYFTKYKVIKLSRQRYI